MLQQMKAGGKVEATGAKHDMGPRGRPVLVHDVVHMRYGHGRFSSTTLLLLLLLPLLLLPTLLFMVTFG